MIEFERMSKEQFVELYKSFLGFVTQAVSISILINGGALIATLTFIGDIEKNIYLSMSKNLKISATFFIIGVVLGGISAILGYMTQFTYFKEEAFKKRPFLFNGTVLRVVLLSTLFLSILSFAGGAWLGIIALPTKI
ncbi:hypothetical protein [Desulfomicrobium baculatum]|uniref:Uncharacterized protein n=1 Tax=Desulfomicrobium baculatum (strain DSM 4028 / VKM B-1378 / X) TaxID=525897 RepID=C7LVI6_DESBD|nr:hypothetical protein [Desulfomicrobium baculatum]ACU89742.1 hypothetical protein Dbac_1650 [Desulfomicrobium baculatum DSM 4028]